MELKEGKKQTGGLRRPFGVAGEGLFLCPNICKSSIKVQFKKEKKKKPALSGGTDA